MMSRAGTAERFLRPIDLGRTRRNHRRLQAQQILMVFANVVLLALIVLAGLWLYRKTQEDVRFRVTRIATTGVVHTPAAVLCAIGARYQGANLFRLNIEDVRRDLRSVAWIKSIAIEKKLPNTLVIHVNERQPAALVLEGGALRYVDGDGVVFADLSPTVGDPSLPIVTGRRADLQRSVRFLEELKTGAPQLYSRISEISPVDPSGYAVFDRDLQARVFLPGVDAVEKWTALYAVARAESLTRGAIEYADLRFRDRLIVKVRKAVAVHEQPLVAVKNEITN
jgi:Cell division septal protein